VAESADEHRNQQQSACNVKCDIHDTMLNRVAGLVNTLDCGRLLQKHCKWGLEWDITYHREVAGSTAAAHALNTHDSAIPKRSAPHVQIPAPQV
jgi:hypothetical protein